ncbi:SpoIIE family protein phosphatase [Streptomyces sp. SBC-4]|nr:SpoIIE family protein phosphatase [Streptomyces sp. SBC-4]MDV5143714.1 SpoIIE family protein phosphatase [Streptomyces sp. SBC-4]
MKSEREQGGAPDGAGPWDEAILEAVFAQSDVGLHVLDTGLRVVRVNTVAVGMRGIPAERIVGLPAGEAYAHIGAAVDEDVLREVLATGRSAHDRLVIARPLVDPRRDHVFSVSAHRLQDGAGRVLGVVVTSTDVTERERAQARFRLLHDAHEWIGTSLDVERTARELVDVAVPRFADAVVVALTDAVLRGQEPGLLSRDPAPLLRCAATGRTEGAPPVPAPGSVLLPGIFGDDGLRADASLLPPERDGEADGTRLVVPLTVRGQAFGAVAFRRKDGAAPYDTADITLAETLGSRTATCLENALRFTREHIVMTALQSWPLRQEEATQRAVDVAVRHRPGLSGAGSWFDVVPLPGARVALIVGQVEHAGLSTVATMSRLRTAVSSLTTLDLDPHELLARLHATTLRLAAEQDVAETDRPTASCTIAVHDPVGGRLDIARAGTSLCVVVRPDGSVDTGSIDDGPLLGAGGPPFASSTFVLPEGSTLCLASAPVAAGTGTGPRTQELVNALARPDHPPEMMADAVKRLLAPERVLVIARTRYLTADELAEWDIPFDFSAVGTARDHVEAQLRRWGHPVDPFTATLVVSELVTNAVRYGAAPITLRLIRDSEAGLICEVGDAGRAAPHLRHAKAVDEGGRGLLICATLAENWGVRYRDEGKTVWAALLANPAKADDGWPEGG